MFRFWLERQSIQFVARKCTVSRDTVRKYKHRQNWDGRLAKIRQEAQEKQDDSLAKVLADNLKFAKYAKGKVLELMQVGAPISRSPISDLDRLIRLELLLLGYSDSRPPEGYNNDLRHIPTQELLRMKRELEAVT